MGGGAGFPMRLEGVVEGASKPGMRASWGAVTGQGCPGMLVSARFVGSPRSLAKVRCSQFCRFKIERQVTEPV